MDTTFLLWLGLFLLCLIIRTTYEVFKKAGRVNTKALFPLIFSAMCLFWISWFAMCPLDPLDLGVPQAVRVVGIALVVLGVILAVGALVQLKGLEDIDHLVTSGLFSKLRHPMYTGFILWIVGWGFYHGAGASLVAGLAGIANILYWRGLEERKLELQFGESYRDYKAKTWF